MEVLTGKVWLNRDWEGESYRDFMEVSSLENNTCTLDEILIAFDGKFVKITIQEIEDESV
ncbi:TPA: hypothetical protein QCX68_004236 [Bacillus wiedmannii]|uniref:hypothetical protein n=1 Tax=Bacillus cereus TaxID=1396 RepID=UPI000BF7ADEA|nr:hypothetical protein [Bacillus cereus]PFR50889.1 hypothetical protein COK35_08885 [Bacillus cereus]HDR7658726.1 hypothetical protein [Bacillus wiedmannii]